MGLLDHFKSAFIARYVASLLRHVVSAAAGALLAIGADPAAVSQWKSSTEAIVGALVAWLISYAWSLLDKKKNSK